MAAQAHFFLKTGKLAGQTFSDLCQQQQQRRRKFLSNVCDSSKKEKMVKV
jgi:hypothetical protein